MEKNFLDEKDERPMPITYILKAFSYFNIKDCFSINKDNIKNCRNEYPNVRFHLADIRHNKNLYKLKTKKLKYLDNMYHNMAQPKYKIYNNINSVKKFLLFIKYKKNINLFYKKIWSEKLIQDQYKKIKNTHIRTYIKKYFDNYLKKILNNENIKVLLKKINKNMSTEDMYVILKTKILLDFILDVVSISMDLYLLLRLFKDFNNNPAENIIIHAGNAHITFYVDFFTSFLKTASKLEKSINNPKRCLDISNMTRPFFT